MIQMLRVDRRIGAWETCFVLETLCCVVECTHAKLFNPMIEQPSEFLSVVKSSKYCFPKNAPSTPEKEDHVAEQSYAKAPYAPKETTGTLRTKYHCEHPLPPNPEPS